MKILITKIQDKIKTVYKDNRINLKKDCYVINCEDELETKQINKGYRRQLKDEKGNLLWNECDQLKPLMGYEITKEKIKVDIYTNPEFWTIEEVLKEKYIKKLKSSDKSHVYFNEFIEKDKTIKFDGNFILGKKQCYGEGIILHYFDMVVKTENIIFDCEYDKDIPNLEISDDNKNWEKVDTIPYTFSNFKAKIKKKIYLKINDKKNKLTAYSFYMNLKSSNKENILRIKK